MIYTPAGRPFTVDLSVITNPEIRAWWFNPRNGQAIEVGILQNNGTRRFTPPAPGEFLDWVLVLDDASKNFPPPGAVKLD